MPRKKKENPAPATPGGLLLTMQPPGPSPDAAPGDEPELSPEQTAELDAIEEQFRGIPGDTPVEIYRYGEDGELGFCGKLPAHTFSPDAVARKWHTAGKYRAIARVKDKGGKVVAGGIRQKVFNLDEISVSEFAPPIPAAPAAPAAAPGLDLTMSNALAALLASVTTAMGNLVNATQNNRPDPTPPVDPLAMLDKVAAVAEKIAGRGGPDQELASRMVGMVNDVLDIKDRLSGNGEPADPLMQIARENLPRLIGVLETAGKNNSDARALLAEMRRGNKQLPAGATPPATADAPAPAGEGKPMWYLQFAKRLPYFVTLAKKDKDPLLMAVAEAELIVGEDVEAPLKEFLAAPDAPAKVMEFAPELKEYDVWVTLFVTQLKESLELLPEGTAEKMVEDLERAAAGASGPQLVGDEPVEDSIPGQNG